ncbi:MAG TPA: hypothetical protein VKA21_11850 [Candidatus Binatia bacterium]|nr:hypothetical protein [Candidatus Binatia bacterium]
MTGELHAEHHGDGAAPADRGERALVAIAERDERRAAQGAQHVGGRAIALLHRDLRDLREALGARHERDVAGSEHVVAADHPQHLVHAHAPAPPGRETEARDEWRGANPRGPDHGRARDRVATREGDAGGLHALHLRPHRHLDAERLEVAAGAVPQPRRIRREHERPRLEKDDADRIGGEAVVARQDVAAKLGERAGHLDAGRAAADDDEREHRPPLGLVGRHDRVLERAEEVVPQPARVVERVEPERVLRDARDPEVLGRAARRDDQVRVRDVVARRRAQRVRDRIAVDDARQPEIHGRQATEDAPRRVRDLLRLEPRDCNLVDEGKEAVVVPRVDPERRHAGTAESAHGAEPCEPRAEHDHARRVAVVHRVHSGVPPLTARESVI